MDSPADNVKAEVTKQVLMSFDELHRAARALAGTPAT